MPARGIDRVRRSLQAKIGEISGPRTEAAVFEVLQAIKGAADTMVPQDTGNLLNSGIAPQITQTKGKTTGLVGYGARYAMAVHEASGKLKGQPREDFGTTRSGQAFGGGTRSGNYWDPGGEPRYLEKGGDLIKPAIPAILKAVYGRGT